MLPNGDEKILVFNNIASYGGYNLLPNKITSSKYQNLPPYTTRISHKVCVSWYNAHHPPFMAMAHTHGTYPTRSLKH
jgi:hypothetical protein